MHNSKNTLEKKTLIAVFFFNLALVNHASYWKMSHDWLIWFWAFVVIGQIIFGLQCSVNTLNCGIYTGIIILGSNRRKRKLWKLWIWWGRSEYVACLVDSFCFEQSSHKQNGAQNRITIRFLSLNNIFVFLGWGG